MIKTICICGAGTMGSGIAQVCAQNGFKTLVFDLDNSILEKAKQNIKKNLQYVTDKKYITEDDQRKSFDQLHFVNNVKDCAADVIIEAIVEKMEAKVSLFNQLAEITSAEVIFATNTSSLSVSGIQNNVLHPQRVIGMHFFNPAYLMKLVEVVKGNQTSDEVADAVYTLCNQLGKTPVMCADVPGFIVNRVARHYYLEAMKLVEEGTASFQNVDEIMEASGFKMGPFKLMDLIGMDVNLSVTESIYESFNKAERFTPSPLQIEKVKNDELGRKTKKGFYNYP